MSHSKATTETEIIGIDFSGGAAAGEKIWVAFAQSTASALIVSRLERGSQLPNSAPERPVALAALVDFLATRPGAFVGCDFPFALEQAALDGRSWFDWLGTIATRYTDAEAFKANFPDGRRGCDVQAKTPFSPLNLRLYRQTFYGLTGLLWPLLANHQAVVLPMMAPQPGALTLVEICPASLLKKEKLYLSYKGKNAAQRANRETILYEIQLRFGLRIAKELAEKSLADSEGDALDAVLAALCVHLAWQRGEIGAARNTLEASEGRVYF